MGRVPDGDAPRPRRAVRGHYRLHVRQPPFGRVGARPAGSRREGGGRRERDDTGADRHRPRYLRRRDPRPVRAGPKTRKKYLQVACTSLLTCYFLGGRDLPSFRDFIYSGLHGTVVVHDRYVSYDSVEGIVHQLCCSHILRDIEDAAESYPDAIWPGQIAESLRALIHAANTARDRGLAAVPLDETTAETLKLFRHGVLAGLSGISRVPGAKAKQPPARLLLECLKHREADVLRFLTDTAIPPTSSQAERDLRPAKTQQKISGRLARAKPPATVTPSAATSPPPANTEKTPSTPSAPPSPAPPGCHPPRPLPAEP